VVAILGTGDFFGEGCLTGQALRLSTLCAMTECVIVRITKADITRVIPSAAPVVDTASIALSSGTITRSLPLRSAAAVGNS
jgi:CRP-like cAMP-binding protein